MRFPLPTTSADAAIEALQKRFDAFVRSVEPMRSARTIRWYVHSFTVFRRYLEDHGDGTANAVQDRLFDLDAFVAWNLARGVSPLATNTYWRALRPFFNDWEAHDGAPNPFHSFRAPGFDPAAPKALGEPECQRLLRTAANYDRWDAFQRARAMAVLGIMLYAGLRKSEVLTLEYDDVNFAQGHICVQRGKGPHGGKKRYVPMSADLASLMRAYLRERDRRGFRNPEFFSSTRTAATGMTAPTLAVIVRTVRRASGIHFSAHMLRHSFVTHLLRRGVPLHVARDLAGHSHVETTMLYAKVFADDRQKAVDRLAFR